jgi:hypothetical protein
LAVRAYSLASDERLAQAATASLAIVAVGILPVILLNRAMAQARPTGPMPYEPVPYGAHAAIEANTNT